MKAMISTCTGTIVWVEKERREKRKYPQKQRDQDGLTTIFERYRLMMTGYPFCAQVWRLSSHKTPESVLQVIYDASVHDQPTAFCCPIFEAPVEMNEACEGNMFLCDSIRLSSRATRGSTACP